MFSFFGQEIGGILTPQPRIEASPTALEGKALTVGPAGKSWEQLFKGTKSQGTNQQLAVQLGEEGLRRSCCIEGV